MCRGGLRASRRISHTATNLNRRLFGCPRFKSQVVCSLIL
ncbi:hypothetical protein LINGRAHAP2_LOCUS20483 [Linum grandiflorum]